MNHTLPEAHSQPTRWGAVVFSLKARLLQAARGIRDAAHPVDRHPISRTFPREIRAEKRSSLWTQDSGAELALTAGKVQNLRAACLRLNGAVIPAGEVFSFWKQLGRITRSRGFTTGRELRSGCLIPNLGGGLCQLSGLLHAAALDAGLEVVERHRHSRNLPGQTPNDAEDATVFWNYVDLRLRSDESWQLECRMDRSHLIVGIRTMEPAGATRSLPSPGEVVKTSRTTLGRPIPASADGDCVTCGMLSCFRHPDAVQNHAGPAGHVAFVVEGWWPELGEWCRQHSQKGDRWLTPLAGKRWNKPNYAWAVPEECPVRHATLLTLIRSLKHRRLPAQGPERQTFLRENQRLLAQWAGKHLDPMARHLVVSQTLLPWLWKGGHLGGRTYDVLMQRWPLAELQRRLDTAAVAAPGCRTLTDFRADPEWIHLEAEALAGAARLITPHLALAQFLGSRAVHTGWLLPEPETHTGRRTPGKPAPGAAESRWFFPASPLGRKGINEMAAALRAVGGELLLLGRAREEGGNPLDGLNVQQVDRTALAAATALVLPAWVEHEPRLALQALTLGVPVIATAACGLAPHPLWFEVPPGNAAALAQVMRAVVARKSPDPDPNPAASAVARAPQEFFQPEGG